MKCTCSFRCLPMSVIPSCDPNDSFNNIAYLSKLIVPASNIEH